MKTLVLLLTLFIVVGIAPNVFSQEASEKTSQQQKESVANHKGKQNDFFMLMSDCRLFSSAPYNLLLEKRALATGEGESFVASCERKKKKIKCVYLDKDQKPYGAANLNIIHDESPHLWFKDKNGTEHWMVDTTNNIAASLNVTYFGPEQQKSFALVTKLCGGVYLTPSDFQKLKEMEKAEMEKAEQEKADKAKPKKK